MSTRVIFLNLDEPTGLKILGHSWISQKGDYYEVADDLPKYVEGWNKSDRVI